MYCMTDEDQHAIKQPADTIAQSPLQQATARIADGCLLYPEKTPVSGFSHG
ncbi:hypothetical protein [Paenibacillus sp. tmac-D7]|uniref:hypothetical protein n=1 Tax=Paenibacillus sp. tmac-D7 TaxID=2591462 RepID=UPI0015E872F3|nr:hypothetical protein [Paenibacillus sp. tmac-D7]